MTENDNKLQDESFAKFVLEDNSRANKRKDIIFLIVILGLIFFCVFKEIQYQRLLSSLTFEETTSYIADTEGDNGNAIINDNGGEVTINGKSGEESNKESIIQETSKEKE